MAVLWLVEPANSHMQRLGPMILGEFPVRTLGSAASLKKLYRLGVGPEPDAIVLHLPEQNEATLQILNEAFPDIPKIWILNEAQRGLALQKQSVEKLFFVFLDNGAHAFDLCHKIHDILRLTKHSPGKIRALDGAVRYREILFLKNRNIVQGTVCGESLQLSTKESQLLEALLSKPGHCHSRQKLAQTVWPDLKVSQRTIDSHISRLRKRLESFGVEIEGVYGSGYMLK